MLKTEAWVLHSGANGNGSTVDKWMELQLETFDIPDLQQNEVLVEPIVGCWEGNMSHALQRQPVDLCRQRKEDSVIIGNAGVVRVLKPGTGVSSVLEGQLCLVFCNGIWDEWGFPEKIYAYDAPGSIGLLAKQTKLHERQLIPVPEGTRHSLEQWAAFSLRFITAWANWKLAFGVWELQTGGRAEGRPPIVWGWGGGVTFAELMLAMSAGCDVTMIGSKQGRLAAIAREGMRPLDRNGFAHLNFDPEKYATDPDFRDRYLDSEKAFLQAVVDATAGKGVSIFVDFIGQPVFRATLKSLARPGVITSAGWKRGMNVGVVRAIECMRWHTHVHTHYARYNEAKEAIAYSEKMNWAPPVDDKRWTWEEVPELAREYALGQVESMFPIFEVNRL